MNLTLIGKSLTRIKFLFLFLIPTLLMANCDYEEGYIDACCESAETYCEYIERCKRPALLSLGVGTFNTLRRRSIMAQFQVEYKWEANWHGIQPIACAMVTQQGSIYVCGGACYDIFLWNFVLTPSFAPGIYFQNGGKDLGYPLEFRSSISLAYEFCNKHRIGVQFYHISNASLGRKNPGEESLVLYYSIALF